MPGDEGYPAYLGSRLSGYYERAGRVVALGRPFGREGSVTAISAVSPPGGDISEPVTQNTLRVVKAFWGLDAELARQRHFPSINWMSSYSLYTEAVHSFFDRFVDDGISETINQASSLLQDESRLQEIVKLVGFDSISDADKLKLEISRSIREDFLQQNAFIKEDSHTSLKKQFKMLRLVIDFYEKSMEIIGKGIIGFSEYYKETAPAREWIARIKYMPEASIGALDAAAIGMFKNLDAMRLNIMEGGDD
jgi:V/A-type H+-transporting ATPase subunit A